MPLGISWVENLRVFHSLLIEVVNDRTIIFTYGYRGCTFVVCGERLSIELIPIAMRELRVIVKIDGWSGWCGDCLLSQIGAGSNKRRGERLVQGDSLVRA